MTFPPIFVSELRIQHEDFNLYSYQNCYMLTFCIIHADDTVGLSHLPRSVRQ